MPRRVNLDGRRLILLFGNILRVKVIAITLADVSLRPVGRDIGTEGETLRLDPDA